MMPFFASDLFGEKSYNKILGVFTSASAARQNKNQNRGCCI